jgi:tetratricopeptide (TPR) repeat protein
MASKKASRRAKLVDREAFMLVYKDLSDLFHSGRIAESTQLASEFLDEVGNDELRAMLWFRIAYNEECAGHLSSSADAYARMRELGHQSDQMWYACHNNAAHVLVRMGQFEEAVELARKSIEIAPHWFQAYKALGSAFEGLGNIPAALRAFAMATYVDPSDRRSLRLLDRLAEANPEVSAQPDLVPLIHRARRLTELMPEMGATED